MMIKSKPFIITVVIIVLIGAVIAATQMAGSDTSSSPQSSFYTVKRDNLKITVTESGSVKALNAEVVKCRVEGRTTIISIVDEGTMITEQDVADGKILVELDRSDIEQRLMQQDISFSNEEASLTEARENYQIQVKQNESDLSAARLKVKFALMDLQKYLGREIADDLVAELDEEDTTIDSGAITALIDSKEETLGGEALKSLRELENKITLAGETLRRAESKLIWTKRLHNKEYASKTEVEGDEFEVQRLNVDLQQTKMALDLFREYDFPKQTEKLLSDYREAQRDYQRTEASTRSKLAQAQARLANKEASYNLQKEKLEKLREQMDNCIIRAPKPGMVVYATSGNMWDQSRMIQEGAQVHERQELMSLTNMESMAVEVKVHEVSVQRVKPEQAAIITLDAIPDKKFQGRVIRIAQMPDQQMFFMNPDLKVYSSEVSLVGADRMLKPGLSAKVEIIIDQLQDVLYVPVQAVVNRNQKKLCFVKTADRVEPREVQTGLFNDAFIVITEGLQPGDEVSLMPPKIINTDSLPQAKKPAPDAPASLSPSPQG